MDLFGGRLRIGVEKREPKEEELTHTNKLSVVLKEDMLGWEGTTPFIQLDENFVQMPLTRTELKIPREQTTRMTYMAWWDGFIAGARGEGGIKTLIIITLFAVIGIGLFNWYTGSQTSTNILAFNDTINSININLGVLANNSISTIGSNVSKVV